MWARAWERAWALGPVSSEQCCNSRPGHFSPQWKCGRRKTGTRGFSWAGHFSIAFLSDFRTFHGAFVTITQRVKISQKHICYFTGLFHPLSQVIMLHRRNSWSHWPSQQWTGFLLFVTFYGKLFALRIIRQTSYANFLADKFCS